MPGKDYFTSRAAKASGKRRLPRLKTELITCELGTVINLSMTGARIRIAAPVEAGQQYYITIDGLDLRAGPIHTEIVWCRNGEAGVRFIKANPPVRKTLSDLAMMARERGTFKAA